MVVSEEEKVLDVLKILRCTFHKLISAKTINYAPVLYKNNSFGLVDIMSLTVAILTHIITTNAEIDSISDAFCCLY
jgi:hypothetical protein